MGAQKEIVAAMAGGALQGDARFLLRTHGRPTAVAALTKAWVAECSAFVSFCSSLPLRFPKRRSRPWVGFPAFAPVHDAGTRRPIPNISCLDCCGFPCG